MSLIRTLFILCMPLLSACTAYQYNTEICDQSRRVDVPHLEGTFVTSSEREGEFNYSFEEAENTITRLDRGVYENSATGKTFTTCLVNGRIFIEDRNAAYRNPITDEDMYGYQLTELLTEPNRTDMTSAIFDPSEFDQSIPYQLVDDMYACWDRSNLLSLLDVGIQCKRPSTTKYLVIDNAKLAPEELVKYARQQFLSVRSYRRGTK